MAAEATREPADDELATAVGRYVLGEISLGKAAENVGMSRRNFEKLLERARFTSLYGPRSTDDLQSDVDGALDLV